MSATIHWATQILVTSRVLNVTTLEEQQQHIAAYAQHQYQHKCTHPIGDHWLMYFVKHNVQLDTGQGDTVPL